MNIKQLIQEELSKVLQEQDLGRGQPAILPSAEELEQMKQAPIKAKGEYDWDEFYRDLEERGLSHLLGPPGIDYKYGKYHTGAKAALDTARRAEVIPLRGPDGIPYAYSTEPGIAKAAAQRAELEAPNYLGGAYPGKYGPSRADMEKERAKAAFQVAAGQKARPSATPYKTKPSWQVGRFPESGEWYPASGGVEETGIFYPQGGAERLFSTRPERTPRFRPGTGDPDPVRLVPNPDTLASRLMSRQMRHPMGDVDWWEQDEYGMPRFTWGYGGRQRLQPGEKAADWELNEGLQNNISIEQLIKEELTNVLLEFRKQANK
jgi:hypothetical protein